MGRPKKSPEKEDVNGDGSMLIFARPGGNPDGKPDGIADLRLVDMSKERRSFREESYVFLLKTWREKAREHTKEAKTDSLALITLNRKKESLSVSVFPFLIH